MTFDYTKVTRPRWKPVNIKTERRPEKKSDQLCLRHDSEDAYIIVQEPMVYVLDKRKAVIGVFDLRSMSHVKAIDHAFLYAEKSVGASHPGDPNDRYGIPPKCAAFIVSPGDADDGSIDVKIVFPEGTNPRTEATPVVRAMLIALEAVTGESDDDGN